MQLWTPIRLWPQTNGSPNSGATSAAAVELIEAAVDFGMAARRDPSIGARDSLTAALNRHCAGPA